MADKLASGLFITELLADNAGGSAIDTDGDGSTNKADEYVELQNGTHSDISLDGVQIWSEKNGLLYSFGAGDTLAAGETATVVGNYTGTPPAGYYDAGNPEGINFLEDGEGQKFDTIFLYDSNTNTYVTLSYGNPPRTPTLPTGFPSGATQIGSGETIDSTSPNGAAFSRDAVTGDLAETTPTPGEPDIVCFVAGTMIQTPDGLRPVESLRPGDFLVTDSHGPQPIRAIGFSDHSAEALRRNRKARPIVLAPGAFGNDRPLAVSQNHRLKIAGAQIQLLFGARQMLFPAKALVGRARTQAWPDAEPVRYFHILFDQHCLIRASGIWVESLYLGDVAQNWVADQRAAGRLLEKSIAGTNAVRHTQTALPCLRAFEARLVLALNKTRVRQKMALIAPHGTGLPAVSSP